MLDDGLFSIRPMTFYNVAIERDKWQFRLRKKIRRRPARSSRFVYLFRICVLDADHFSSTGILKTASYMKICGRRNPNLSACVRDSVEQLRGKFAEGIPELDVPPMEPLVLKGFPLADSESLKAYARNVKMYGLTNFIVKHGNVDLEKKQLDIDLVFNEIHLQADYDVKAKILVPIEGSGPIDIKSTGVEAKVSMQFKLLKRKNEEILFFPTMTTKLKVADYTADFKPSNGQDGEVLRQAVHAAIAGGHEEILETIRPTLERVISEEVLRLANNICKHFTYNELYPDRE